MLEENKRICLEENIPFVELEYNTTLWNQECGHLMNEPERGKRCQICFYLRLKRTAEYAKQNGFTHFTSVLGISPNGKIVCASCSCVIEKRK